MTFPHTITRTAPLVIVRRRRPWWLAYLRGPVRDSLWVAFGALIASAALCGVAALLPEVPVQQLPTGPQSAHTVAIKPPVCVTGAGR